MRPYGGSLAGEWSERQDLNLRPLDPQSSALPGCATLRRLAASGSSSGFWPQGKTERLQRDVDLASRVGRLRQQITNAVEFHSALKLRFQDRDADAMACLAKIYAAVGEAAPSEKVPILVNLLRADLCLRTGSRREAYDASVVAIAQLRAVGRSRYRKAERDYLLYASKYIVASTTEYVDSEAFNLACSIPLTYRDIDISSTRSSVRQVFSMNSSWAAEFDAWFLQNALKAGAANAPGSSS
jgi:hypothetical protein